MVWRSWGKHSCGFVDAELPAQDGGRPVSGRIFYPAPDTLHASTRASWLTPWRWRLPMTRGVPWLWHGNYARGLGKFLFFRLKGRMYDALKQVFIALSYTLGRSQRMDFHPGAPLAPGLPDQLPVVIFSHGLGGHRLLYSIICAELASQGYVVLAVEHFDGSASAARLPGGQWMMYGGLGDAEAQVEKTRVRVAEMKAALRMMQALNRGEALPGLALSHGQHASAFFKGRLDMRCVAAAGHSYGGATTTALVAEDPLFRCAVALDPWWHALFPETKALRRFETRTPLLIMGSHDWNVPNHNGQLACGGERQEAVLAAAKAQTEGGTHTGGGAMLLSIAGSSHNTFADALPLFGQQTGWLLQRLGLSARLDPVLGIHLCTTAMLAFLSLHLPLTEAQRALQNWEPVKPESAPRWRCIRQHDEADAGEEAGHGPLSWMFPGRGLVVGASDSLMNHIIPKPSSFRRVSAAAEDQKDGQEAKAPKEKVNGSSQNGGPDDVVTGAEAAEAALPSASPASGHHPHAPGARTDAPPLTAGLQPGAGLGGPAGATGSGAAAELSAEQQVALLAALNTRHSSRVESGEVDEMVTLLGRQHVFKCFTV